MTTKIKIESQLTSALSDLSYVKFIFGCHPSHPNDTIDSMLNTQFPTDLDPDEFKTIFVNEDPTQGLLKKTPLLQALRKLIVDHVIAPEATATADIGDITRLVQVAPLTITGKNGIRQRVSTNQLQTLIKTNHSNGDKFFTINIETFNWYYPPDGP